MNREYYAIVMEANRQRDEFVADGLRRFAAMLLRAFGRRAPRGSRA
ncbi:hypothetical protein QCN27_05365 [Cereibacter sp. SYSU M97828]|nr:hypothetical protein [Cereibacter flavus]